jgi:hypothetical protein
MLKDACVVERERDEWDSAVIRDVRIAKACDATRGQQNCSVSWTVNDGFRWTIPLRAIRALVDRMLAGRIEFCHSPPMCAPFSATERFIKKMIGTSASINMANTKSSRNRQGPTHVPTLPPSLRSKLNNPTAAPRNSLAYRGRRRHLRARNRLPIPRS